MKRVLDGAVPRVNVGITVDAPITADILKQIIFNVGKSIIS